MDFYIYLCFSAIWLAIGLLVGYKWHAWEASQLEQCHAGREKYEKPALTEVQEPDHDEVARRLLNY